LTENSFTVEEKPSKLGTYAEANRSHRQNSPRIAPSGGKDVEPFLTSPRRCLAMTSSSLSIAFELTCALCVMKRVST
jgi:hypothetical protein